MIDLNTTEDYLAFNMAVDVNPDIIPSRYDPAMLCDCRTIFHSIGL